MKKQVKAVIIGAGPAGSVCGYLLKQAGVECVIVDYAQFPREKVCGGGLTPKAYTLLGRLMPELKYDYHSVSHLQFLIDGRVVSDIHIDKELRTVVRKDFDYELLKQYLVVGGELIRDCFAGYETCEDGKLTVTLKSGEQISCDYLIGADGANSRVRKTVVGEYRGNTLWMEQYLEAGDNVLSFEFSNDYERGYYYRFPNVGRTIVGAGGYLKSPKDFRELLTQKGIKETKIRGANIPVETVASQDDRIMLIGDAGGFPNKISYEGLYYAIATGQNAFKAIVEGKSFRETNGEIFRRKRKEEALTSLFYSRLGLWMVRMGAHSSWLIKKVFQRYA